MPTSPDGKRPGQFDQGRVVRGEDQQATQVGSGAGAVVGLPRDVEAGVEQVAVVGVALQSGVDHGQGLR